MLWDCWQTVLFAYFQEELMGFDIELSGPNSETKMSL